MTSPNDPALDLSALLSVIEEQKLNLELLANQTKANNAQGEFIFTYFFI